MKIVSKDFYTLAYLGLIFENNMLSFETNIVLNNYISPNI